MTTVLNGLLGGLVVGAVAAAATRLVAGRGDASSAPATLGSTLGRGGGTPRWIVLLAEATYGSVAGGTLVALELSVLGVLAVPPTWVEALPVAVGWGALLFAAVLIALRIGRRRPLDRTDLVGLAGYHLCFGVGLGVWIRLTWIT